MRLRRLLIAALLLTLAGRARAEDEVRARLSVSPTNLVPGASVRLTVEIEITKPWHINANPASEGLIATELKFETSPALTITHIEYPAGQTIQVGWSDQPVALYSGQITILADARVANAAPGPATINASLRYQACDDEKCLLPKTLSLTWETEVVAALGGSPDSGVGATGRADTDNSIDSLIRDRGAVLAAVVIFLGGLALNLTPCVYPMIAITVSYFGGREGRTRGQAFASALVYCLGIVVSYTVLGVVAALTGGLFGALLQSRVVLIGIAVLLVGLALSLFGLFEIRLPQFLVQRAAGASSRSGHLGVFLLGATMGIIAAPCLAPFVVALLAYVGATGEWWWFIVFSGGLALPYVMLGTFSGLLAKLPKSGTWMVWVKRVFGVALILVAIWFVKPILGSKSAGNSPIDWKPYSPELIGSGGRPVLIDFYADWCIPCHEMDKRTFTDQRVIEASKKFLMVKADLTRTGAPDVEKLTDQFRIVGVPTFVFLGVDGRERGELRQVGFVPADQFLAVMNRALTALASTNAAGNSMMEIPPALLRQF